MKSPWLRHSFYLLESGTGGRIGAALYARAGMANTDQFRVLECGTIIVESAEVDYDPDNRGGDLRNFRYWSDRPPDLQEHTDDAQG